MQFHSIRASPVYLKCIRVLSTSCVAAATLCGGPLISMVCCSFQYSTCAPVSCCSRLMMTPFLPSIAEDGTSGGRAFDSGAAGAINILPICVSALQTKGSRAESRTDCNLQQLYRVCALYHVCHNLYLAKKGKQVTHAL